MKTIEHGRQRRLESDASKHPCNRRGQPRGRPLLDCQPNGRKQGHQQQETGAFRQGQRDGHGRCQDEPVAQGP